MTSYIYSGAKNRRSGTTMQQVPRRGELSRARALRETLLGYPWEGRFTSRAEVDAYLAGDEITCLLCGRPFQAFGRHLVRIHSLDMRAYKERFGIPQKRGINGASNIQKRREKAKELNLQAYLKPSLTDRHPRIRRRRSVPYVVAELKAARMSPVLGRVNLSEIKADGRKLREIADDWGISQTTVWRIKRGLRGWDQQNQETDNG